MYFPTIMNYISYFHVTDLHPSNAYFPISTSALLSITISNFLQPLNASHPIFVTDDGISTLVNPLQPENAPSPISVTDDGISTLVNLLQPANAPSPISVTDDGISTLFKKYQSKNAPMPIEVTVQRYPQHIVFSGIMISSPWQFSCPLTSTVLVPVKLNSNRNDACFLSSLK